MSLQKKLKDVATAAAIEATTVERGRCLWCVDQVIEELRRSLQKKLLGTAELHVAQTKFKIANAVAGELRRAIVSGVRPPGGPGGATESVTADPLPAEES